MAYHIFPPTQTSSHWIFAFYGFGQKAEVYNQLVSRYNTKIGFVIMDLPYQDYEKAETKTDFLHALSQIIKDNNITKITGLSYSMGSRYNLILAELIPMLLDKIILIAPDGIKINFWNRFVTTTFLGKVLFRYFMHHPKRYTQLLNLLHVLKILPRNLYLFSKMHTRNSHNSIRVFNAWMNMKNMIPDLAVIKETQQKYSFSILAFYGKYDFVINQKSMAVLKKEIPNAEIKVLEKGHNLLDDELFADIARYL